MSRENHLMGLDVVVALEEVRKSTPEPFIGPTVQKAFLQNALG